MEQTLQVQVSPTKKKVLLLWHQKCTFDDPAGYLANMEGKAFPGGFFVKKLNEVRRGYFGIELKKSITELGILLIQLTLNTNSVFNCKCPDQYGDEAALP